MKLVEVRNNHWSFEDPAISDETFEKLDLALDTWDAGLVERAEIMLRAIVADCPSHIDALHHLSLICDEQARALDAYVFVKLLSVSDCKRFLINSTGNFRDWSGACWITVPL